MKRCKGVIFLVIAAVILWGCAIPHGDPTDYSKGSFTALISGRAREMSFSATLSASPVSEDGSRGFSLELTAPETLCGMRVEGDLQSVTLYFEDIAVYSGALDSLPTVAALMETFTPKEAPISVSAVTGTEAGLPKYDTVTILRFSFGRVCLDPKSGDPIMIKALPRGEGFELEFTVDSFTE